MVQGAFVLFRLFRKPDDRLDVSKYDEVEPTGLSPTMTKSSPEDTSSDLVQETAVSDTQAGKQSEGIQRWLTDKSDNMTTNDASVPVDSACNSYLPSEVEDHAAEEAATEVRSRLQFSYIRRVSSFFSTFLSLLLQET